MCGQKSFACVRCCFFLNVTFSSYVASSSFFSCFSFDFELIATTLPKKYLFPTHARVSFIATWWSSVLI